jgi:ABC-type transporter Mla maintaining outer membrane lipid asymmetry ATPase subunit MlaF
VEPGTGDVVIELRDVRKDYRGLRPLRVGRLAVRQGDRLALVGFDHLTAEVFVNLVTGATVPDEGDVRAFGESTSAIENADAWLASLDRFGIVSDRAVLLDALTVAQNIAVPLTLELEPVPDTVRAEVERLAGEVGLASADLPRAAAALGAAARQRVRLARALALNPRVLLAEHPNAPLPPGEVPSFAADYAAVVAQRGLASVVLTADRTFAAAVADQVLTLQPATGELTPGSGWRRFFSR